MDLDYFKDQIFNVLNEMEIPVCFDIETKDKDDIFLIKTSNSTFEIKFRELEMEGKDKKISIQNNEIEEILSKANLKSILSFLQYEADTDKMDEYNSYGQRLIESVDELFKQLKKIFPTADKENEILFNAIMDFAEIHNNIYFEIGILVGNLIRHDIRGRYKNLSKEIKLFKMDDNEIEESNILKYITKLRLEEITKNLVNKPEYQNLLKKSEIEIEKLEDLIGSKDDWLKVDRVISAYNALLSIQIQEMYMYGFKDCYNFLNGLI